MQEEITRWLSENVSEVIATAFSIVCYFLYIVNNRKVGNTKTTLQTIVKEKVTYVDKENKILTAKVKAVEDENLLLRKRLEALEKTVTVMLEEDVE